MWDFFIDYTKGILTKVFATKWLKIQFKVDSLLFFFFVCYVDYTTVVHPLS